MPSSSTGCALIAGTEVSIRGVWVATAGDVLCGNVVVRVMGEMGVSLGGEMGVGSVIAAKRSRGKNGTCATPKSVCSKASKSHGLELKAVLSLVRSNKGPAAS